MKTAWVVLVLPLGLASAFQVPFRVPFFKSKAEDTVPINSTPRVAIIGAGAAGSSAAFWISKAKERFGLEVEIDVYDRLSYIGGRSITVYPYNDTTLPPVELGASIFVEANKNLWRASDEFNLTRRKFHEEGEGEDTGIFDGQAIVMKVGDSWWSKIKAAWKYGIFSIRKTDEIVNHMIQRYLTLYSTHSPIWDDIAHLSGILGWTKMTNSTSSTFFESQGIGNAYIYELMDAATRVNYGHNIDEINALLGTVTMSANDATGIKGGNFQIFEKFLEYSNASVFLNTAVHSVTPKSSLSDYWTVKSDKGSIDYKTVIIAAPYHSSKITIPSSLDELMPEQPYVHLHVTLLATTAHNIDPTGLGLPASEVVPRFLLTTYNGARSGGVEPEFNSLSYHGTIRDGEYAVKIFSKDVISDEWLQNVFGEGKVGWVYRKEWDAYPVLPPTDTFPPVRLQKGLYYVNAFESFISTMETETVASRNVVDLLLNEEFGSSICGPRISSTEQKQGTLREVFTEMEGATKFVIGWDC